MPRDGQLLLAIPSPVTRHPDAVFCKRYSCEPKWMYGDDAIFSKNSTLTTALSPVIFGTLNAMIFWISVSAHEVQLNASSKCAALMPSSLASSGVVDCS